MKKLLKIKLEHILVIMCITFINIPSNAQQIYGQEEPIISRKNIDENTKANNQGTPDIYIPISTSPAVSLVYDATGIKPDKQASQVGLNWSLEAGGEIIRTVRGLRDEQAGFHPTGLDAQEKSAWDSNTLTPQTHSPLQAVVKGYDDNNLDKAPDEFFYNIIGRKGKFIFKPDGTILADKKIVVSITTAPSIYTFVREYSPNQNQNIMISSITLIFEDGVRCSFAQKEPVLMELIPVYNANRTAQPISSLNKWKITSIEFPNEITPIIFAYQPAAIKKSIHYSDDILITENDHSLLTSKSGVLIQDESNLSSIRGATFELVFNYEIIRKNPWQNTPIEILKSIITESFQEKTIMKYEFTYNRISASKFLLSTVEQTGIEPGLIKTAGLYKLEYNLNSIPEFDYFSQDDFYALMGQQNIGYGPAYVAPPLVNTAGVDHWGYYNGVKPSYNTLIGEFSSAPSGVNQHQLSSLSRADREPDAVAAQSLLLQKITYPTGGYIQYIFEGNDYSYIPLSGWSDAPNDVNYSAGGLRIKQIIKSDGINPSKNIIKTFEYTRDDNPDLSSGVLSNYPLYNYHIFSPSVQFGNNFNMQAYTATINTPYSMAPSAVTYSCIKEINGDGSYTVYKYSTIKEYNGPYDDFAGTGNCYLMQTRDSEAQNVFSRHNHPFVRGKDQSECMRGLLLESKDYSAVNKLVRQVSYTYTRYDVGTFTNAFEQYYLPGRPYNSYGCYCNRGMYVYVPYPSNESYSDFRFWRAYNIYVAFPQLTQKVEKVYDQNSTTKFRQATESYTLTPTNFQPAVITRTDISGDITKEAFYYLSDYASEDGNGNFQMNGAILHMKQNNMLISVVEHRISKVIPSTGEEMLSGDAMVKGEIYEYNATGLPEKKYVFESTSPVNNLPFNQQQYLQNSYYYKLRETNVYDPISRKLITKSQPAGVPVSTVWGYNNTYPIASVMGATTEGKKIFHTSFEDYTDATIFSGGKTGNQHHRGTFAVPLPLVVGTYKLTFWQAALATPSSWSYQELLINVPVANINATQTLGSSDPAQSNYLLDEVRLYPSDALITTMTYEPLRGISSTMEFNGVQQSTEYDGLGRKLLVKDNQSNIIQAYQYGKISQYKVTITSTGPGASSPTAVREVVANAGFEVVTRPDSGKSVGYRVDGGPLITITPGQAVTGSIASHDEDGVIFFSHVTANHTLGIVYW